MSEFLIVTEDGITITDVDFVPCVGMKFYYHNHATDWLDGGFDPEKWSQDSISFWKSLDGKEYEIIEVWFRLTNYNGNIKTVPFAVAKELR